MIVLDIVSHGRYVTFHMAEVAVPRQMFQEILSLIARLRHRPRQHERDIGADATDDGRGVPAAGRATRFSASARSTGDFDHLPCTREAICHCLRCPNGRPGLTITRNPENVG